VAVYRVSIGSKELIRLTRFCEIQLDAPVVGSASPRCRARHQNIAARHLGEPVVAPYQAAGPSTAVRWS